MRKSPIKHQVKAHLRKGKSVRSFTRGTATRRVLWKARVGKLPTFIKTEQLKTEGFALLPYNTKSNPTHGKGFKGVWQDHVVQVKSFKGLQHILSELKKEKYGFNRIDILGPMAKQEGKEIGFILAGRLDWNGKVWIERPYRGK